jgi:hypothetical protein
MCRRSLRGFKDMFPTHIDLKMPQEAYKNWCNTVRWKWTFQSQLEDFEPGLLLRSDELAPEAPRFFENGLTQGRKTMQRMLQKLENTPLPHTPIPKSVDNDELKDLLSQFKLLCLPSNKNLGVALV